LPTTGYPEVPAGELAGGKACHHGSADTNCGQCPRQLCSVALQTPGAGAGSSPGACTLCIVHRSYRMIRTPAASQMEGTVSLLLGQRSAVVRDGHPRGAVVAQAGSQSLASEARGRGAGADGWESVSLADWKPASSGCGIWGVSSFSDEAHAGMRASCSGNAIFEHTCRHNWRYRVAAGLHSSLKDCTACALYLCTPGRRQTMTFVGSGALALRLYALIDHWHWLQRGGSIQ
jgi:hypothetical protein